MGRYKDRHAIYVSRSTHKALLALQQKLSEQERNRQSMDDVVDELIDSLWREKVCPAWEDLPPEVDALPLLSTRRKRRDRYGWTLLEVGEHCYVQAGPTWANALRQYEWRTGRRFSRDDGHRGLHPERPQDGKAVWFKVTRTR